jgi:drug/metabolite transporter (DMT)-like permease
MILALGGVILVILKPSVRLHFSLDTLPGDLLTLAAGICGAVFFAAWSKPLLRIYSPLRLMGHCMIVGSSALWLVALFLPQSVAWGQIGAVNQTTPQPGHPDLSYKLNPHREQSR